MAMLGYGEDALTLWALTRHLDRVIGALETPPSPPESCMVLLRPSFGRSGGPDSPQFGEFDFIIGTPFGGVYLGESKWEHSPELSGADTTLRPEQMERHRIFRAYYQHWVSRPRWLEGEFFRTAAPVLKAAGITKPVPPDGSRLAENLQNALQLLAEATGGATTVVDVLLVADGSGRLDERALRPPPDFRLVYLDASADRHLGFLRLTV